eukprot:TRINITY_DN7297_c0_g1_i1.p1 TRINITY_DN7297_c0_g1~~TRINITY_DN7297_c0_g1_i1.p1  ORF type:complete len:306 (-),score=44.19 TRINITY_DN7297_c0_g1_i1:124-1041(-)
MIVGRPKCFNCGVVGHRASDCYAEDPPKREIEEGPLERKVLPPYIDTHVHINSILKKANQPTFDAFQKRKKFPDNYAGSISNFCFPLDLFSLSWEEQLRDPKIWGAFGIHPHNASDYNDRVEQKIIECLQHPKAIAWGECGLDYNRNFSPRKIQIRAFTRQVIKAAELKKTLVVHSRDAEQDVIDVLKANLPTTHAVHLHSFNESSKYATTLMDHFPNLFFGISGMISFWGNYDLQDTVRDVIPLSRIILETDGPHLLPMTADSSSTRKRHEINHPGIILLIIAVFIVLFFLQYFPFSIVSTFIF